MKLLGTVVFTGKTGAEYTFNAYWRSDTFNAVGGVYFMTKRVVGTDGEAIHTRIYVGETGDLSDRPLNPERQPCFDRQGANCICVLVENDYEARCAIEIDLRRNYNLPC